MTLSAVETDAVKRAPAVEGVLPVFHERWSARSFSEREVSAEALRKVFEAARWAASGGNGQPWRFVVGMRGSETYDKIFASLAEGNRKWAHRAPVLILGTALRVNARGAENPYALFDLGAASSYLTLEAAALGLTAHQMAGYNHEAARKALGIPEEYALGTVIALGYQDEPEVLGDEELIQREIAPRTRKPLSEVAFRAWDVPEEF
ncbi:MAG: nitroreductase family protein [Terracidiphilus sp.]